MAQPCTPRTAPPVPILTSDFAVLLAAWGQREALRPMVMKPMKAPRRMARKTSETFRATPDGSSYP